MKLRACAECPYRLYPLLSGRCPMIKVDFSPVMDQWMAWCEGHHMLYLPQSNSAPSSPYVKRQFLRLINLDVKSENL